MKPIRWPVLAIAGGVALFAFIARDAIFPIISHRSAGASTEAVSWPRPDSLATKVDDGLRSAWIDNERQRYTKLLQTHACETLVVPVQSQQFGFSRATRSLMTAELALAIGEGGNECVVDPYLAARALGEGMRRYEQTSVESLARTIGARTIVWAYAGHDSHSKMDIFIRAQTLSSSSVVYSYVDKGTIWENVPFSDDTPPFVAFQRVIPEFLAKLGRGRANATPVPQTADTELAIPDSPELLLSGDKRTPLDTARRFELLAEMGPQVDFRETERLYEKAWLNASAAQDTPQSRRARARALLHLGYRPAAAAMLKGDDTPEGTLLRNLADGNLPEAEAALRDVGPLASRVAAELDVLDLRAAYGRLNGKSDEPAALSALRARSEGWDVLVDQRMAEANDWRVDGNLPLKRLLDHAFPIQGYSTEAIVRAAAVVGEYPDGIEVELLAHRHIDRLFAQQAALLCCATIDPRPGRVDLLEIIAARAEANLEKAVNHQAWIQGRKGAALDMLASYDRLFQGNPHFSAMRAKLLLDMAKEQDNLQRPAREQMALAYARSAAFWEQTGDDYSFEAAVVFGIPSQRAAEFTRAYEKEFPPRIHWAGAVEAIHYSAGYPSNINLPLASDRSRGAAILAEVKSRFHGSRDAARYLTKAAAIDGAPVDLAALRAEVADDPGNWEAYARLSRALVAKGDYGSVVDVVRSYPGFQDGSGENSVGLSNKADSQASLLFWHGELPSATALYQLAARYDNGSESSMRAAQRLHLMAGEFPEALEVERRRVERYGNPHALLDYLSLLFATGHSRDAWAAFMAAADRIELPEFWFAASTGHRMAGATSQAVLDWLGSDAIRAIRVKEDNPALRAGMTFFLIDRAPFPALAADLARIEGKPLTRVDVGNNLLRPLSSEVGSTAIFRSGFRIDKRHGAEGDLVPSPFVLLAAPYEKFRLGDFAAAVDGFAEFANYYSIEGDPVDPSMDLGLPYFAIAAARTGDQLGLQTFLDSLPEQRRGFEYHLAKAQFAGLDARGDEARSELHAAFAAKPMDNGVGMIADYQYAEACILLFDATHDDKYRILALDWAHTYQRMVPTMAWAYALEARYGDRGDATHIQAVAKAQYLDPQSFWLSGVAKQDVDKAKLWLARNSPFGARRHGSAHDI